MWDTAVLDAPVAVDTTLLERETGGVRVTLLYDGSPVLTVRVGEQVAFLAVTPAKALDAFHHPFAYLSDEQVTRLLPRP